VRLSEPDEALRYFQRDGVVACGVMALIALVVMRGQPDVAAGIIAGGVLMALSYSAIKGGVDAVVSVVASAGLKARATSDQAPADSDQALATTEPVSAPADPADPAVVGRAFRPAEGPAEGDPANISEITTNGDTPPRALSRGRLVSQAVKFFTRYALLAIGAYVMLTRFRLHPAGLLVGATSPFIAAVVLAARMARTGTRRERH
jgi:hypothetical protein